MERLRNGFAPSINGLQPAAVAAWIRRSLFVIPGLGLVTGVALAETTVRLDRADAASWLPDSYETTSENARAVFGAIATGTITVVTLMLTLTLVAVQLAAGQLSPRTISDFLGDRLQQITIGLVLGTASFSLAALRSVRVSTDSGGFRPPDLTVLGGVALTFVSLLFLIASVDRTASRLAVGTLIDRLAGETCELIRRRYGRDAGPTVAADLPRQVVAPVDETDAWVAGTTVATDRSGWVQYVDEASLIDALPDGARVRLLHPVGTFVFDEMILVEVDRELSIDGAEQLRHAIVIGSSRTKQQDISFGITRLVDIGLRALSPGVNDANTAREVILRLGQVVLALQEQELLPAFDDVDGHGITRVGEPDHGDYVAGAFNQIRSSASRDAAVLETLARTLRVVRAETERRGLPGDTREISRQEHLVAEALERVGDDATASGSLLP